MIERLFNNFSVSGSSESRLLEELTEMSNISDVKEIIPYNLRVCCLINTENQCWKVVDFYPEEMNLTTIMDGKYLEANTHIVTYEELHQKGLPNDLIHEIESIDYYLSYYDKSKDEEEIIIPAPTLQNNILALSGCGKAKSESDPINKLWLAHNLEDMDNFAMIVRKSGNVQKGFAVFAKSHKLPRQDDLFRNVLEMLRKLHSNIVVNHFAINGKRTYVEIALPDLKTMVKIQNKRFIITPCFAYNYGDLGDYAASLTSAIILNGRVVTIGDLIRVSSTGLEAKVTEELITLNRIIDKIKATSEEVVDKKENLTRILKKIGFYSNKVGDYYKNLYQEYIDNCAETCTKLEILIEILNLPSVIHYKYMNKKHEMMPLYITDILAKITGNVFSIDFDKECF